MLGSALSWVAKVSRLGGGGEDARFLLRRTMVARWSVVTVRYALPLVGFANALRLLGGVMVGNDTRRLFMEPQ